ncbi:hypothetical protein C0Q88_07800 [Ralstonia pickettii]|uniref:Uncharacterized protein n=1 Tax=Ralstonia pickettii TaxID=329 RepID=A0A2N4TXY4_RALPI|nr:hypothetical protein [Ralstonia pickettii]PLC44574.1 hypothetical protein C0Q88_07800 [Ralstonia pickettii]
MAGTRQYVDPGYVESGYVAGGSIVMSDLIVSNKDVTADDFRDMMANGHAPTYTPFRPFIVGDYDYRFALFRTVMKTEGIDRIALSKLDLSVDVPDITDRGQVTIDNPIAGARVTFARSFHKPPEMSFTMKGGTVFAIPSFEVDESGFNVWLKDPVSGNKVAGTVSWTALGY